MKVAIVSHSYPSEAQPSAGKFISDQAALLSSDPDIEVEVLVPTPHAIPFTSRRVKNTSALISTQAGRFNYLSFPKKRLPEVISSSLSKHLARELEGRHFDLAHVHWLYPDGMSIPALKELGLRTLLTVHGSDWYQTKHDPKLLPLLRRSLEQTDRVLYSGPQLKADMEQTFPGLAQKGRIIYNMVDEDLYRIPTADTKRSLRKELNWDPEKRHVLTVANIRKEKGLDLLLDALLDHEPIEGLQFHLIGASDDSSYAKYVIRRLERAPKVNITYHPPVPPAKLVRFYQASDLFLLPSRREGFNVSLLEAMACGLPVLVSSAGGSTEVVGTENGKILKDLQSDTIHRSIMSMAQELSEYDSGIIRNAVIQRYGKEPFLLKLKAIYEELI